jgi:hypothetical protein
MPITRASVVPLVLLFSLLLVIAAITRFGHIINGHIALETKVINVIMTRNLPFIMTDFCHYE